MQNQWSAWFVARAFALAACGTNNPGTPDAPGISSDAGDASSGFVEAAHPSQPTVQTLGGSVLAAPKVVPIFFTGDATAQAQIESFLTALAASSYWPAISGEYGVGPMTIAPSIVATEAPPTTDSALQALISSHAGGTGGWPAKDANTIYTVFLPDGITLTAGSSTSCNNFDGYHDEISGAGGSIVYALMPRCPTATFPDIQSVTIATSHELLEASTDPHTRSSGAFADIDQDDVIWTMVPGAELGDMCETARAAYQPLVCSFMVQRTWSNASAAAGHDPCVPVLSTPYVEAVTNLPDITLAVGAGQSLVTRGIAIPVGMSKVVEVDLYSDAPASDWTVEAIDVASKFEQTAAELSFSFDKTTGHNGDKLQLTITRLKAASQFGVSELGLQSKVNGVAVGTWWTLVSQ